MAIEYYSDIDINAKANIVSAAGSAHLLTLHNTSNGEGCSINFSDKTAGDQTGTIDFLHQDSVSQGGGASFVISSSENDMVLNVGGRILATAHSSNAEVDYGFVDDIDTGMMRSGANAIRLVTGGSAALDITSSQNANFAGDITCGDDFFMPSAGVINFNSGDMTITHASNQLTVAGGTFITGNIEVSDIDIGGTATGDGSGLTDVAAATAVALTTGNKTIQGVLSITGDGSNAATFTESGAGHLTIATVDDFVIDAGGQVNIDADGGSIRLKDGGTQFGLFSNSSSDLAISSIVNNKDIIFKGEDDGSTITALTLDMSDGGKATFNNDVVAFSDKKLKDNIETLDGKKVLNMRGVSFTRKDTGLPGSGVIAQEIQKVAPELVNETNGTLGVSYGNLVGYLIEAIKDQQKQIDELKEKCNGCSR